MNHFVSAVSFAGAMAFATAAGAATITYNFDVGSNLNLGTTQNFGNPILAAAGGSYSGTTIFLNNDLYSNDRGLDEQGLGICSSQRGNSNNCSDSTEIQGSELVHLDLNNLNGAGYNTFSINADSATSGEQLWVYASTTANSLGTKIAMITSANGTVGINTSGDRYLNFISGVNSGGDDVLLHSLTATQTVAVPEPASLALLASGLLGLGFIRRRKTK